MFIMRKFKEKVKKRKIFLKRIYKNRLLEKFTIPLYQEIMIRTRKKEDIKRHPIQHGKNPHQYGLEEIIIVIKNGSNNWLLQRYI